MVRSSRHIIAGAFNLVLMLVLLCPQSHAAQKLLLRNKAPDLIRQGYVEVSGDAAVRLLVGNSIVVRSKDTPPGYGVGQDYEYYFLDSRVVYNCYQQSCSTEKWRLVNNRLCLRPIGCEDPSFEQLAAPTLFKAPSRRRGTDLGVFLEYHQIAHRIVSGHSPKVPLFDPDGSGARIEFDRADIAKDIGDQPLYGDRRAVLREPLTTSLRIGNTFASDETVKDASGHDHWCPIQGSYYSLDGRVVVFNCDGGSWPGRWSFLTLRWKMEGDRFCQEDPETRDFGCLEVPLYAVLAKNGTKVLVTEDNYPRKVIAYTGNVFNIHFENRRDPR